VLVEKQDSILQLSLYRKPTHSGLYINWTSFIPYKLNLITGLISKAYETCYNYKLMHKEFELITRLLIKNGYPQRVI